MVPTYCIVSITPRGESLDRDPNGAFHTRHLSCTPVNRHTYTPTWPVCIFELTAEHATVNFTLAEFQVDARCGIAEVIEFAFLNSLATNSTGDLTEWSKHLLFLFRDNGHIIEFGSAGRFVSS